MKNWMLSLAVLVGVSFASAPGAEAQTVAGKVTQIWHYGQTSFGLTGGMLGRMLPNGTYWFIYTTPATPDASLARILNIATASGYLTGSNYSWYTNLAPYVPGSTYVLVTTATTGFGYTNY